MLCESEIEACLRAFPTLTRDQVATAIRDAGPNRTTVEASLRRMAHLPPGAA